MADKIGDGEHEEGDDQEDADPNTDEVRVNWSKLKIFALIWED